MKNDNNSQILLSDIFHFCMNNNKNKYYLIYHYLNFIHGLVCNEFYLDKNEILILFDYLYELLNIDKNGINDENIIIIKNENNDNNINQENVEIKKKLISIILSILIDLIFVNLSDKDLYDSILKIIKNIEYTKEILVSICGEIEKIFQFLFNKNNNMKNITFKLYINLTNDINISKIYSPLFKFIFKILNYIINNDILQNKSNIDRIKLTNEILSLLISINKKSSEEFQNKKKMKKYIYMC